MSNHVISVGATPRPGRRTAAGLVPAALVLALAGCASRMVEAQWSDPRFAGHSLRGARVLVVCSAQETAVQRICQDELSAQVAAVGATPVAGSAGRPGNGAATSAADALGAARDAGAAAILAATVAPEKSFVRPGPTMGVGVGVAGGSGGHTSVGTSVGISLPVGGPGVDTAYAANLVLTDVASGEMMWTSKVTARASRDVQGQIGQLAKVGMEAAREAGMF
jgi:hypothetical protein